MRPPPRDQLDPKARTIWRLSNLLSLAVVALVLLPVAVGLVWLDLVGLAWVVVGAIALVLVLGLTAVFSADVSWRHWRYEVAAEEVDLQRGVLVRTRTLIPMAKIQHVDTRRGPLERRFQLATVVLHTAAGANEIPALAAPVADQVRDRIAELANVREDL